MITNPDSPGEAQSTLATCRSLASTGHGNLSTGVGEPQPERHTWKDKTMHKHHFSRLGHSMASIGAVGLLMMGLSLLVAPESVAKGKPSNQPSCDKPFIPEIVYRHIDGVGRRIVVANADGSCATQVTNPATTDFHSPNWLPDGTGIVFVGTGVEGPGIYYLSYSEIEGSRTVPPSPQLIVVLRETWSWLSRPGPTIIEDPDTFARTYEIAYSDGVAGALYQDSYLAQVQFDSDGKPAENPLVRKVELTPDTPTTENLQPIWLDENTLLIFFVCHQPSTDPVGSCTNLNLNVDLKVFTLDPTTREPDEDLPSYFAECDDSLIEAIFEFWPGNNLYDLSPDGQSFVGAVNHDVYIFDVNVEDRCFPKNVTNNPEWGTRFTSWVPSEYDYRVIRAEDMNDLPPGPYIAYTQTGGSKSCGERTKPTPNPTVQLVPISNTDSCFKNTLWEIPSGLTQFVRWRPVRD